MLPKIFNSVQVYLFKGQHYVFGCVMNTAFEELSILQITSCIGPNISISIAFMSMTKDVLNGHVPCRQISNEYIASFDTKKFLLRDKSL
jgi:hypothetical protein